MKRQHLAFEEWSGSEYAAIVASVLRGRLHQGPNTALLKQRLGQMYAPSEVHLVNYGHCAIEIALNIFKRQRPECLQVIVPAYVCPSVTQAVAACGLRVVSIDVQNDLNMAPANVQAALNADTLAVIAPHMYGCPALIGEIEALCKSANVFLIDDAAQVLGVQQSGRLLGTFGDVGVISFAQSKAIVTGIKGSGGVLLVNRPEWMLQASRICDGLPPARRRLGALADFLWNYVAHKYTGNSGYYFNRLLSAVGLKAPAGSSPAMKISNLEAGIALAQLDRLDFLVREKVRIADLYFQAIQEYPLLQFPQFAKGRFLSRVMLLLPQWVDAASFRSKALALGVETRSGYPASLEVGNSTPLAQAMAGRLLGVPCRAGMDYTDVRAICAALNQLLEDNPHDSNVG